jgi:CRISPR/Cas system-associated exonuclease Cas4 (RecB family)
MTGRRAAVEERLARADPGGLLYGGIVTAAVLAAVSAKSHDTARVAVAVGGVLLVYYLAHVYVETQAMQFAGDDRLLHLRVVAAAREEVSVLQGGVPAIVVYVVGYLLGLGSTNAALVALWFSVGFLLVIGYLGAHRAGLTGWRLAVESGAAGAFGLLAVFGKLLLH